MSADHEVRREEMHIYLHLDPVSVVLQPARPPGAAVAAILTIGGQLSTSTPQQLSIDDTTGTAQLNWVDDKGDTDAAAPAGAQVTYSVDDAAVATVDPQTGVITPVAEGSANLWVAIVGADGNPLMEADGTTPFSAPAVPFQVVAGAAVGAELAIKS